MEQTIQRLLLSSELMIGDIIITNYGGDSQISKVNIETLQDIVNNDIDAIPLSLTDEILRYNNFEESPYEWFGYQIYDNIYIVPCVPGRRHAYELITINKVKLNIFIDYVHELQHILIIYGNYKKIEVNC